MANTISELNVDIRLGMNSVGFDAGTSRIIVGMNDTREAAMMAAGAFQSTDSSLQETSATFDRSAGLTELLTARMIDMSVQMSGLFQAQQRLGKGRRELQRDFDKNLDINIQRRGDDPNARANTDDLQQSQSQLHGQLELIKRSHAAIQEKLIAQRSIVEEITGLRTRLVELQRHAASMTDGESADMQANKAAQEAINQRLAESVSEAGQKIVTIIDFC